MSVINEAPALMELASSDAMNVKQQGQLRLSADQGR